MPELAEVEFMRRRWDAGLGEAVSGVDLHPRARIFRGTDTAVLVKDLRGATLRASHRSGKQMVFHFGSAGWLALHLGMTGELRAEPAAYSAGTHDHLVLRLRARSLVFSDPRMFGAVDWTPGEAPPTWWTTRPPEILERGFTLARMTGFLTRRGRAPIKAVLLMQEMFPGIGNWMADEVLWRARIHPRRAAGSLELHERASLHRALRFVCRGALKTVARGGADGAWADPPRGWLFHERWSAGGKCPITKQALIRETIGGRTTCWSPGVQKLEVRSQRSQVSDRISDT